MDLKNFTFVINALLDIHINAQNISVCGCVRGEPVKCKNKALGLFKTATVFKRKYLKIPQKHVFLNSWDFWHKMMEAQGKSH